MNADIPTAHRLFFSGEAFDPQQLERLEKAFFSNIILRNGTFKTPNHHRLDNLNELVRPHLPNERPLRLMDVAVSSGVSTAEWIAFLDRFGITHQMTAGDLVIDAYLVAIVPGLRLLVDQNGHALQFDIRGKAIRTPVSKRHFLRYLAPILLAKALAPAITRTLRELRKLPIEKRILSRAGINYRPLKLMSTSLTAIPHVEVVEDDILISKRYAACFHAVRAANILNRVYFDDTTLTTMLLNLRCRLISGGLLIVCRTNEEGLNNATVFKLGRDGIFAVVARLNDGSEIESLALALPAP